MYLTVKGREWYQAEPIAEAYEDKRFSGGGRLIDRREKQAVLSALGPVEDRKILEIACGTGRFTVMLAERDANVTGIDISPAMLTQGRDKARAAAVQEYLEFLRGDAARLPFPDNIFDAVFAIRFFHLADTPSHFLAEMRRVASEVLLFDTFNATSARSLYNWALPMGSRLYSRAEVAKLLDDAGVELVNAAHDFLIPYGLYRGLPGRMAKPLRRFETSVLNSGLSERLATVSYWTCRP